MEYSTVMSFWVRGRIKTKVLRHVVAVKPFTKVGKPDAVLDQHSVVLRTSDERSIITQDKSVIFDRTPGAHFANADVSKLVRTVCWNAATCMRAMT